MTIDNTEIITTKKGRSTFKYTAFDLACAEKMHERIVAVIPYADTPNFESWADTLRKMRLIDKRPAAEIGSVFRWANQDPFWQTNILSPAKLRKHFARLHKLMAQDAAKQQQPRRTRDIPLQESLTDCSWATGLLDASTSETPAIECSADSLLEKSYCKATHNSVLKPLTNLLKYCVSTTTTNTLAPLVK